MPARQWRTLQDHEKKWCRELYYDLTPCGGAPRASCCSSAPPPTQFKTRGEKSGLVLLNREVLRPWQGLGGEGPVRPKTGDRGAEHGEEHAGEPTAPSG